jgi:hypothetical protein
LFRGGLYLGVKRATGWWRALVMSSSVYALVHFFAPMRYAGEVHWYSGLQLLPQMFSGFLDWQKLLPGFLTLTVAGILLAMTCERSQALYAGMGIHAGWVFWLKTFGFFTNLQPGANPWIWGSNRLIDGWLVLPMMTLSLPLVLRLWPKQTHGR